MCLQAISDDSLDDLVGMIPTGATQGLPQSTRAHPKVGLFKGNCTQGTLASDLPMSASIMTNIRHEDINVSGVGLMDVTSPPFPAMQNTSAQRAALPIGTANSIASSIASQALLNPTSFNALFTGPILSSANHTGAMHYPERVYMTKTRAVRVPSPSQVGFRGKHWPTMLL